MVISRESRLNEKKKINPIQKTKADRVGFLFESPFGTDTDGIIN